MFAKYVIISNNIIIENEEYNRVLKYKMQKYHLNKHWENIYVRIFLLTYYKNNFGNKKIPRRKIRSRLVHVIRFK